jgi:hypothetical protein
MDRSAHRIQLPQRFLGLVLAGIGTELADDRRLRHLLLRQRRQDALDIRPFPDNHGIEGFARGLDQGRGVVAGMMTADQAVHLFMQIAVPRGELIAEDVQDEKVHMVGAVGVCRMPFRLHVCGIVVQDIVDVV